MIDIVYGVYEDKWCAPLVVFDVADAQSFAMDFYLPAAPDAGKGVLATLVVAGKRHVQYIARDTLTRVGPVEVGPGGARLAVEFAATERLPGTDVRQVSAVLARLFVDGQEAEVRPPAISAVHGAIRRDFRLQAV